MPVRRSLVHLVCACALALVPASAARAVERVELIGGLAGTLNGVATGADGNVYVVESGAQKVAVLAPDGTLVRRVALPGPALSATSATLGPDGRVWISISSSDGTRGFARIDAAGVNTPLSTAGILGCGPIGLARLSAVRTVFTAPSDGACSGSDHIGGINADSSLAQDMSTSGRSYDLAVAGGKVFVPDFDGNTVARWGVGPQGHLTVVEATVTIPSADGADGIEVGPGGNLFVTMYGSGQVARVLPGQDSGTSATIVASGLKNPFGMATGSDDALYVASQDARLLRIAPDGTQRFIALPAGFKAWQVAARGDDIWVTDNTAPRAAVVRDAGRLDPPPVTSGPAPVPALPAPIPTPAVPKPLAAPKVFSLAAAKRCASRRSLTLTLRKRASGPKATSVKVTIGSGKAKTYKGAKLKVSVTLTGLPRGSFKVKVAVVMSDGTTVSLTRTYKTCATKKKR
jgi:sugar lactone lactonase YvrE